MLGHGAALLAATDGSTGQYGLPLLWILALTIGATTAVGALTWALVRAMRRPAPWERPGRDRP